MPSKAVNPDVRDDLNRTSHFKYYRKASYAVFGLAVLFFLLIRYFKRNLGESSIWSIIIYSSRQKSETGGLCPR